MTDTVEKTTYLLSRGGDNEFAIELPSTWKITFATVNPASMSQGRQSHCVRVYEMPGSKLRAVFDSIVSVRDMAIPLAVKQRQEVGTASWRQDSSGSFSRSSDVKVNTTFVAQATSLKAGTPEPEGDPEF